MSNPNVPLYNSAPATAIVDQNYNLTLSWVPTPDPNTGLYTLYDHWDISSTVDSLPTQLVKFSPPAGWSTAGGSLTFTQVLSAGNVVTLSMQAWLDTAETTYLTNPWEISDLATPRFFPNALVSSTLTFYNGTSNSTSLELGQPLTVTLNPAYVAAGQWQILWPDGTNTGWLPLSIRAITKSFSTPGAGNVVIQTRYSYSGSQYDPPTTLIRQFTQQIYVVDQQSPQTQGTTVGLTGYLGISGQQGFEIVTSSTPGYTIQPWEVIARAIVRDTITNELKLLVATSRYSNASSLFGTMAVDVFPLEGRPHAKGLITPPYELTTTSQTETSPVVISTTSLPNLIVGKSVTQILGGVPPQLTTSAGSGIAPFIWNSTGLPNGIVMNTSGVVSGTPLELGLFYATFSVQDSSIPFSIAEVTLPLLVTTDLLVEIAPGQTDANGNTLVQTGSTLGWAQVNTPYAVQMQVGNINTSVSIPGGLPPYTWSIPAGALPVGLSINPNTGLISGSPCTYNSTTDFSTVYSATVQVTDAIGAKATQTYTMQLEPAMLTFGQLDQPVIYATQQFRLVVPVFGGLSPYVLSDFLIPSSDSSYYSTASLIDGQVILDCNFPQNATGVHTFSLIVRDSASHTANSSFNVNVESQTNESFLVPGFLDYAWQSSTDVSKPTPIPVTGNFSGFILNGLIVELDAVAAAAGGTTIYTDSGFGCSFGGGSANAYAGYTFAVSGFQNSVNNGTFLCTASTTSSLTLNNPNGVAENLFPITFTLTSTSPVTGVLTNVDSPFITTTTYTGTVSGGAGNAYAGQSFEVSGFPTAANNGTFYCTNSSSTTLTLSNPNGVAETGISSPPATAVQSSAKALQVQKGAVLSNGITVAIDPNVPEIEFSGPPSGVIGNAQYIVPLQFQLEFEGSIQATISQTFTTLAANAISPPWLTGDIGAISTTTRPYLFGASQNELVGLNPRKPFYNSPSIPAFSPTHTPTDGPWVAAVQSGSGLPPGLSLDANTGLIYGTLVGSYFSPSVIQYVGTSGTIHGTVTISWTVVQSMFQLQDNIIDSELLGTMYPSNSNISVPGGIIPQTASILYGRLPSGLTLSGTTTGQNFLITGTPLEAGYFDVWFQITSTNNQSSYLHHRFSINFINPLTIVTTLLPNISAQSFAPYYALLQGFGGVPPYTWSSSNFPGGTGIGNFSGLTLSSSGVISSASPWTQAPATPTDLGDISITLTDSRGSNSSVNTSLDLYYSNSLTIITPSPHGIAIVTDDPNGYAFIMQAAGGNPPYSWSYSGGTLTSGISFSSLGAFSGIWTGSPYVATPITITVQDSTSPTPVTTSAVFNIQTGSLTAGIEFSTGSFSLFKPRVGTVGFIPRGEPYQGTLIGICTQPPVAWQIAPTAAYSNTLLSGLTLQASGNGATATISGTYSGVPHVATTIDGISITQVARSGTLTTITANNTLQVGDYVIVTSSSNSSLNGTWLVTFVDGTFPASNTLFKFNTVASGTILPTADTGTATGLGYIIRVIAVDNLGDTAEALIPLITGTNLVVIGWDTIPPSNSPFGYSFPLPNDIITAPYGPLQLIATHGVPVGTNTDGYNQYTWNSPQFPLNGLILAATGATSGQISGAASSLFSPNPLNCSFTVTDSIYNQSTIILPLFSQVSGLTITTVVLPNVIAGRAYGPIQITAALGTPPYTFSVSPRTASPLPTGITLTSTGVLSGTTTLGGYTENVTLRVTDSIGAYSDTTFPLVVKAGLNLQTGIDYTDSTNTLSLGYITAAGNTNDITPNPNLSFYVIATGVISTSLSNLVITLSNPNVNANPISLVNGVATFRISETTSEGLSLASLGVNNLSVTVVDSGVSVTKTFTWTVYNDGVMVVAPATGSLPTQTVG